MEFRTAVREVSSTLYKRTERFRNLEIGLAAFCAFSPVLMILFDSCRYTQKAAACLIAGDKYEQGIRAAISHYWDMPASVAFYVPLTVAFMIFLVRAAVRNGYDYNWILGLSLFTLVGFNHEQFTPLHTAGVVVFFAVNVLVVARALTKKYYINLTVLGGAAIFLVAGNLVDSDWSGNLALWLEWASLLVIAVHFILVAWASDETYEDSPLSPGRRRELAAAR